MPLAPAQQFGFPPFGGFHGFLAVGEPRRRRLHRRLNGRVLEAQRTQRIGEPRDFAAGRRQICLFNRHSRLKIGQSRTLVGGSGPQLRQIAPQPHEIGFLALNEAAIAINHRGGDAELGEGVGESMAGCGEFRALFGVARRQRRVFFVQCDKLRLQAAEFGHVDDVDGVESFSFLLEFATIHREFSAQKIAFGDDFAARKREQHFKPPRREPQGAPPERRRDRERQQPCEQESKREYHRLFDQTITLSPRS